VNFLANDREGLKSVVALLPHHHAPRQRRTHHLKLGHK